MKIVRSSEPGKSSPSSRPQADLSVVIPCLDAAEILPRQLDALAGQEWSRSWEVIIADNGSTDATRAVAATYQDQLPALRVVDASARRGRQHACNDGANVAGTTIVFLDADDEVAPGYIAAIGDALTEHPIVAASIDHETLNFGWTRDGRSGAQTAALQDGFGFLPFGSGGTLGVRREIFETLGGFADDMHYAEDVDFCWRAQLAGVPIHFVSQALLRYRYRPSLRLMYRQHRNFGRASALLYRTYRDRGMARRDARTWLHEWSGIAKSAVRMRSRADAARWSRRVGRCVGRLEGSIRHRVWFP
jgi:GT2 family glycosyltransferase